MAKLCSRCKITEVTTNPDYCRECVRERGRLYRLNNKEKYSAYQRDYHKKVYPKNKEILLKRAAEWRRKNPEKAAALLNRYPEKRKARQLAQSAIRNGTLQKKPCEKCGSTRRVEKHHPNYDQPLEIVFLCHICHRDEEQRRSV